MNIFCFERMLNANNYKLNTMLNKHFVHSISQCLIIYKNETERKKAEDHERQFWWSIHTLRLLTEASPLPVVTVAVTAHLRHLYTDLRMRTWSNLDCSSVQLFLKLFLQLVLATLRAQIERLTSPGYMLLASPCCQHSFS